VVDSLGVQPGDQVAAGQVLCLMITREAQAALRGATLLGAEAQEPARREEAARALALARRELNAIPLIASRAGTVIRLSAAPGSEVAESAEILALLPAEAVVFEAHVSPGSAARVRLEQPAEILEEGRSPRAASVRRILPMAGAGDQSTLVWLRAAPGGAVPEIDRYGTAVIETGAPRRALAVPDSAVVEDDLTGEKRVALITPGGLAVWTPTILGAGADGWHELLSPDLPPGSKVIVRGQHGLPDSTRVQISS
jgi:hypothetical protein